ncbi:MAG: TonB-dependent receptor [Bacteroidales bacterium]|nr:TonB-dependent receptor [Bacteroidales bacterium]
MRKGREKGKMKKHGLLFFFMLTTLSAFAQRATLSGVVKNAADGETVFGAYLLLVNMLDTEDVKYTTTNNAGFYTFSVASGDYILQINMTGFKTITDTLSITQNIRKNYEVASEVMMMKEVVVTAERRDENVSSVNVGRVDMKIESVKALPALFGEPDVIKAIQLLPGVQSGGEGNSGFYVRGGNADQNLILLDEATVYNASHLFGFFSVFNANAVKNIELYKSGIPAYHGGRLSSILDVRQKEGNMKIFSTDGGIGLIFSNLTVQGPIKKDKASFIISGRRTYIDLLIQPFLKETSPLKGTDFYFYDLNAKLNYRINDKHHIFLGGYYGKDLYGFKSENGGINTHFNWANAAASMRWNYIITPKLFLNTSLTFSDYDFGTEMAIDVYRFKLISGVRDYALKSDLTWWLPDKPHVFTFGAHYIFHKFNPNSYEIEAGTDNQFSMPTSTNYYANELSLYINDEFEVGKRFKFNAGLRFSWFSHIGSFTRYILDEFDNVVDSTVYKPGEVIKSYFGLEPRLSARFLIHDKLSLKASYTLNNQYLHQVSMASISLPTDVWMPSTDLIKPQMASHFSLGLYYNFKDNMYESYVDGYYKKMYNLIEYQDGIDLSSVTKNPDQLYTIGEGQSYGVEFYLKKNKGKFTGFAGYTLSFTTREFEDLNEGKPFYARYDRRHDVSLTLSYEIIRNKLSVSAVWILSSGNTMTVPTGLYLYGGTYITEYSERNAYRMPSYHRLDLSVDWTIAKRKRFETGINLSIYNVYNRKNPFFIFIDTEIDLNPAEGSPYIAMQAYQMSLFPILPSLTWNFKF